ncbi:UDP-glucose 4-epimerase [Paraburkholderia domus]|uniref:UDP-glucose 4-epimerase family protein n=1 Tax=Paraburkholderia domus TaxID=2793075 RepID=UPI0019115619|nr:SDR family oxidoreductase [Paraburkholderia domus]MBK5089004.1 SDR family oxidoreductase [Burkholderia sp. R-69927]CAE6888031.1 UDP-glucose 4-epimerase [Paraburkholderia domus]
MSHIAVTGANGFVGRAVVRALQTDGHQVTALVRQASGAAGAVRECIVNSMESASWPEDLVPDAVIHLAARVHIMRERVGDPLAAFREANVAGALRVAEAAHRAGTRRLVFVSSIKAVAEGDSGRPLREDDRPQSQDAYGMSKLEAERALTCFSEETGLEVVIVRPPLVYGPEVRANFLHLMAAVAKGIPLPLGSIAGRRSLVYNENLADALVLCATDARAAGECFHVTDGADLTVAELAIALARHLHTKARLLPVPETWLRTFGRLTGRSPLVERLIGELRVDSSHIHKVLQWQPRYTADEGLAATAQWYRLTH